MLRELVTKTEVWQLGSAEVRAYWEAIDGGHLYSSSGNLQFYLEKAFEGVDFAGKKVLDIGAGVGLCSCYAACMGAVKVVALEPEAAGSTTGVRQRFNELCAEVKADQVMLLANIIQEFDPGDDRFDVIILDDSVNHLDEDACTKLHLGDKAAITSYLEVFRKLNDVASDGAKLVITDCSRHNFFAMLGMTNPFCPTIEWHKHQSPCTWAKLLVDAGFRNPKIRWRSLNRLKRVGRQLTGNRLLSFFLLSRFFLTMEKP